MTKNLNILIATGIYPPSLGGPAQYAYNLKNEWEKMGHMVKVKTFTMEHILPSGIRHLYYFLKIIPSVIWSDFIFALDTFSVGWPATCAANMFGKKIIIRTGGDFLWEGYVERSGDLVLLKDFYTTSQNKWSKKERLIFKITKWVLHNVDTLVFSTSWQKEIWARSYDLDGVKVEIIENYYGKKEESFESAQKNFIGGTRKLKWKNLEVLNNVFKDVSEATLDLNNYTYDDFIKKISKCYATILTSLGDISPNMILESIRYNKPFILTKENGLMDHIGSIAIIVDPKNPEDIKDKVLWLCKKENYDAQVEKIKNLTFTHTWSQIAMEVLDLYKKI